MAKLQSAHHNTGVEPVLRRHTPDPFDPRLCCEGGQVHTGMKCGRDDDPVDFDLDDQGTNFAYDGEDGLPLDRKLIFDP